MTIPTMQTLAAGLDWDQLRFPGEKELRAEVERHPALVRRLETWCVPERVPGFTAAPYFERSIAVDASVCPALAKVAATLAETCSLPFQFDLRVIPLSAWLVEAHPDFDGKHARILLSSLTVERLWVREALFAIGRKLARLLLEHWPLLADPTTQERQPDAMSLLARGLWKFQELSCDRVGYLFCQNLDSASRAIAKEVTGLPDNLLDLDRGVLIRDRSADDDVVLGNDAHDFFRLRLAALDQFANEATTRELLAGKLPPPWAKRPKLSVPISAPSTGAIPATPLASGKEIQAPADWAEFVPLNEESDLDDLVLGKATLGPAIAESSPVPPPRVREVAEPIVGPIHVQPTDREIASASPEQLVRWYLGHQGLRVVEQAEGKRRAERELRLSELLGSALPGLNRLQHESLGLVLHRLRQLEFTHRLGIIEDLLHLAVAEGTLGPGEEGLVLEAAEDLGLTAEDLAVLAAEFIDPEYAGYPFQPGETVEAHLDGSWLRGTVVDRRGQDVVVRFGPDEELTLNPRADLVRPAHVRPAA